MNDQHEQRLLFKDGSSNIHQKTKTWKNPLNQVQIPGLHGSIVILIYMVTLILCWVFFAIIYYVQEKFNGNICEEDCSTSNLFRMFDIWMEMVVKEVRSCWPCNSTDHRHDPCVANVDDFAAALLFSVETQQSIGYGFRHPESGCWFIIFAVTLQSIIGVVINSLLCGLALFRFSKSRKRFARIQFSKKAMLSLTEDGLSRLLVIRVNDLKGDTIRKIRVRALLVARMTTQEGEDIPNQAVAIKFAFLNPSASLTWPISIYHTLTSTSPLYLLREQETEWELMVWVTGLCKKTGDIITNRASYIHEDIVWGGQFVGQGGGGVRTSGRFGCRVVDFGNKDSIDSYVSDGRN